MKTETDRAGLNPRFRLTQGCAAFAAFSLALSLLAPGDAQAQCRQGSGPDHGDGIPYCAQPPPARPGSPAEPKQWHDSAAAIAWGDGPKGDVYIGVELYVDEQLARDVALEKCRAKDWQNCQVATSITNGVIAVGTDSKGRLRIRTADSAPAAREGLLDKCAAEGVTCKVLKVYDGRPLYY